MVKLAALCLITCVSAFAADTLEGAWSMSIVRFGEPEYNRVRFEAKDGRYVGKYGRLNFDAALNGASVEFTCTYQDDDQKKSCGVLTGKLAGGEMKGAGKFFGDEATWTAHRGAEHARNPQTRDFAPTQFHRQFSGAIPPALHLNPGDTVRTKSVDAGGHDENNVRRSLGGNPLTGPFYIEGALPGDTLVVRLNRVRLNRDSARMDADRVVAAALNPYYAQDQKSVKDFDSGWKLDRERGVATLAKPTEHLKNFSVPLHPMLGCIGVAPPGGQSFRSGNLGSYGGNMDYNQFREGVTLYLPVFQTGALLFLGDAHATQGDGELTGNALETSMDIEFTVDLIEGDSLGQVRAENDEYVIVSGIAGSLDDALRSATTGMKRWLEDQYKLNPAESAMVLGSSMRYDIAEVVDPQAHIVAKLPKTVLAQLSKP
jgi:amidase